jgi:hypothetical protein
VDEIHMLAGPTFIDSVAWDDGLTFPDPIGASMELGRLTLDAVANDAGVNWIEGAEVFGSGDLGTPGEPNAFVPPVVGTHSRVGVLSGDDWTVCRADDQSAWLNADNSGEYNALEACESVGYTQVTAWGGTFGNVCSSESFDGAGGSDPTHIAFTVHWLCEL